MVADRNVLRDPEDPEFDKIDAMTHMEMGHLHRFAPSGHPYFDTTKPYWEYYQARFQDLGGMTTAISKAIGWG